MKINDSTKTCKPQIPTIAELADEKTYLVLSEDHRFLGLLKGVYAKPAIHDGRLRLSHSTQIRRMDCLTSIYCLGGHQPVLIATEVLWAEEERKLDQERAEAERKSKRGRRRIGEGRR